MLVNVWSNARKLLELYFEQNNIGLDWLDRPQIFIKSSNLRIRQTRHDESFYLPRIRSEAGRRQFAYRAPQLYNGVPVELTALKHDAFKKNLRLYLKREYEKVLFR